MTELERRQAQKLRRDAARADKRCLVCCKRPAVTGKSRCVECTPVPKTDRVQSYRDGLAHDPRADKFNVCCAAWAFHRADCAATSL